MSVIRIGLLLCFVCLPLSIGLFFLGKTMGYEEYMSGYAVLSFDASTDDSFLRALLADVNLLAESPVSESSQWVILDNFHSLETVPLDKYFTRLASFDPRNDGYAEKLRELFVRDNRRFIYVPLEKGNWTPLLLDKKFKEIFADISFSGEYYGAGKPYKLYFASFAAASLCLLIICYVKRYTPNSMAVIAALIPLFSSLAFFGAPGIACASLFFAFFIFFKDPFNELSALLMFSFDKNEKKGSSQKVKLNPNRAQWTKVPLLIYKEVIKPYRTNWFFFPVFAAAAAIIITFSQLKLLFITLTFAAACAVFFFSSKILSLSGGGHRRFTPVLIMKRRSTDFSFSLCMLPFTAAAFCAFFLSPYISGVYASDKKFDIIIEEQDYYAHLAFQSGFSTRQLGAGQGLSYQYYVFDEDGLPYAGGESKEQAFNIEDFPVFPLRRLMDFFQSVNNGGKAGERGRGGFSEIPAIAVLLLFAIPLFIKRRDTYSSKSYIDGIKRFSFKPRIKSKPPHSGKYQPRILKDA